MRVVKHVKSETSLDLTCNNEDPMLFDLLPQVKAVEQKLKIESYEKINETLTNEKLKIAGEMFLYLSMCSSTIKPWILFYEDLFQTQSPDQIILALNRMLKGPRTNKYFKDLAGMFSTKILNILSRRKAETVEGNQVIQS